MRKLLIIVLLVFAVNVQATNEYFEDHTHSEVFDNSSEIERSVLSASNSTVQVDFDAVWNGTMPGLRLEQTLRIAEDIIKQSKIDQSGKSEDRPVSYIYVYLALDKTYEDGKTGSQLIRITGDPFGITIEDITNCAGTPWAPLC